jgi:hypothetical protein
MEVRLVEFLNWRLPLRAGAELSKAHADKKLRHYQI